MALIPTRTARTTRPRCAEEPRRSVRVLGAGCPTACVGTYSPERPRNPLKGSGHLQLPGLGCWPGLWRNWSKAQQNF